MDRGSDGWITNRWGPTAPESRVLLDGPKGSGAETFRLAVLELIARRRLAVAGESDLPDGKTPTGFLIPGAETRPTGHRPLDAIQELFGKARARTSGVSVKRLARATRKRYGSFDGYAKTEVLPALERRGLYERRGRRLLWILPVTRWELTRSGEAARTQLEQNRKLGEEHFREWVNRDLERAYRFLGLAGSSLLLMEALHPELMEMQDLEDEHRVGNAYPVVVPVPSGDLDALPDLAGALSAQDSWSEGGSGDGGGSTGSGWFDGGSGGWFDGGGGGFDGGGGGFDGGGGGGF